MVVEKPKGANDPTQWRRRTPDGRSAASVPVMARLQKDDHAALLQAVHRRGAKTLAGLMRQILHEWIEREIRGR
jgi:hypothetical protein